MPPLVAEVSYWKTTCIVGHTLITKRAWKKRAWKNDGFSCHQICYQKRITQSQYSARRGAPRGHRDLGPPGAPPAGWPALSGWAGPGPKIGVSRARWVPRMGAGRCKREREILSPSALAEPIFDFQQKTKIFVNSSPGCYWGLVLHLCMFRLA